MEETKFIKTMSRIDASHAPELEKLLQDAVAESSHIEVDFAETVYICSLGLRVLLAIQKKLRPTGGSMILKNVRPEIMEIFEVTGFSGIFTFE